MLDLHKLRRLIVLAEERNFTRAAERLGVTQPSLSRSIAHLEQGCGLRLFNRGRLGVTLTAAGADLVSDAKQILGRVGAIEQYLLFQSRGEAGKVTLGLGPLAASYLITRLLSECATRWPLLRITALIDATGILVAQVLDGRLDFCLCAVNGLEPHGALSVERLGALRMGYFVRASHPLANAAGPLTWADLAVFPRASGTVPQLSGSSSHHIFGPLGATLECEDYEVLRQITAQTDTIWLASDRLMTRELAEGYVREIRPDPDAVMPSAEIGLVRLAGRSRSAAMQQIADVAVALMRLV